MIIMSKKKLHISKKDLLEMVKKGLFDKKKQAVLDDFWKEGYSVTA